MKADKTPSHRMMSSETKQALLWSEWYAYCLHVYC